MKILMCASRALKGLYLRGLETKEGKECVVPFEVMNYY